MLEEGLQAVATQVAKLRTKDDLDRQETWALCKYIEALLGISKDAREAAQLKNLKDVSDAEIMGLICREYGVPLQAFQSFLNAHRPAAKRAS